MERLVQLRNNTAGHDTRLRRNGVLNQARVKAYPLIVDKELIGPADAGHASVLVHAHEIVGIEILLPVNRFQLEEYRIPQPPAAHRRRRKKEDAGTGAV